MLLRKIFNEGESLKSEREKERKIQIKKKETAKWPAHAEAQKTGGKFGESENERKRERERERRREKEKETRKIMIKNN